MNRRILSTIGPVNWAHPLNRGRMAWWLATPNPGWQGGNTWRDLVNRRPGGLIGFDASTGWPGGRHDQPGGLYGSIKLKNASSYLDVGTLSPQLIGRTQASLAIWVYRTAATLFSLGQGAVNKRFGFLWHTSNIIYTYAETGAGQSYPNATVSGNGWFRVLMTFDGSRVGSDRNRLYINGLQVTLGVGGGTPTAAIADPLTNTFRVGSFENATTGTFNDFAVWNRALTATDAGLDYRLSRLDYPDALNWIDFPALASTPAGAPPSVTEYPASLLAMV